MVNSRGANTFVTLLGKGKNAFRSPQKHPTGKVPLALIVNDFNQDGHLDIAVTLTFAKMELYLGNGNGFFKKGETYLTGSRSFSGVAHDYNGDSHADIALAVSSSNSSSIRIFWGNGDGTLKNLCVWPLEWFRSRSSKKT